MNLDLTETQTLLLETVSGYLEKELPFDRVRELEREQRMDEILWKDVVAQGWLALPFAESTGGAGGTWVDVGHLLEAFARRAAIVPLLEVIVCARALEAEPGAPAAELLRATLAGEALPVPAVLEVDDRFDAFAATVSGGTLRGEKRHVDYGESATHHLVAATEAGEAGLFVVEAGHAAVTRAPLRSIGRTPVCDVRYDGVPAARVAGADAVASLVRVARALAAIQCTGAMREALDQTVKYARVREQFGRPIGSFQAVHHHCANMAMRVASARLLAFEALSALDAGHASDRLVALAKASASRAAPDVLMLAHQIHGGNGVIEENDLYFFTLRGKERSLAWGTPDECLAVVADSLETPPEWL